MRYGRIACAIVAGFLVFGCRYQAPAAPQVTGAASHVNPCLGGGHGQQGPNGNPVVCIDYATFDQPGYQPDPNPVQANRGVRMDFWFNDSRGELEIQFTADTPVQHQQYDGEHFWAIVRPDVPPKANIRRKYSIVDRTSGRHADPEVIIEP